MEFTQLQVLTYFGHFAWPFLRITGLMLTAPILGSSMVPATVKSIIAALFAACLMWWLPNLPPFPGDPITAIYIGFTQICYGAMLGMIMQCMISAVACAGEIMGLAMSLSFAELQFRDSSGSTPVLYDIMLWAGLIGFLSFGGTEWIFTAFVHSFDNGVGIAPISHWIDLANMGGVLLQAAVTMAMPVLAISLCLNLTVGLTTVFASQMNLLSVGFPLLILAGLWVISDSVLYFGHNMHHLMMTGMGAIQVILHG